MTTKQQQDTVILQNLILDYYRLKRLLVNLDLNREMLDDILPFGCDEWNFVNAIFSDDYDKLFIHKKGEPAS